MTRRQVPPTRRLPRCEVVRRERRSAHVATVRVGGPELAEFTPLGGDQWPRLFFRRDGQPAPRLPSWSGTGAPLHLPTTDLGTRPWVRSYSVRATRVDPSELDIDVVVPGDGSPGSRYAHLVARPGDEVGMRSPPPRRSSCAGGTAGRRPRPRAAVPDTAFEVVCARSGDRVAVAAGETVLDALLRTGHRVGSGCREGVCASCEIAVLEGIPDHRDSLGAPPGRMYPCVSRARGPRLVVDL